MSAEAGKQSANESDVRQLEAELQRVKDQLQATIERHEALTEDARAVKEKLTEEELRKFASLVENSTDFVSIALPEGEVRFVNPAGQEMLGLDGDEQVRTTVMLDYVAEQDRERFQNEALPTVMRDGHWEGEMLFRHFKTGASVPVWQHIFFITEHETNRRLALATISRDITERKQVELQLEDFAFLIENSGEFVGICDMEMMPTYCNPAGIKMIGLESLAEARRTPVVEFFFPEDRAFMGEEFFPRVLREDRGELEIRFRHFKTGAPLWMVFGVAVLRNAHGEAIGFSTISRNITEQKQAAEALRESEEHLRALVNQTIGGIAETDFTGRIAFVNDRFCEIVGYTREELLGGMRLQDFVHPDDLPRSLKDFENTTRAGTPFEIEKRYVRKDGLLVWVHNSISAICDAAGKPQSAIVVAVDITERKRAGAALQKAHDELEGRVQRRTAELSQTNALLKEAHESVEMILDSITDRFFALDKEWRMTAFNKHAEEQLKARGKNPASLIGRVLWDEFPNSPVEEVFRRAMNERVAVVHEHYYPPLEEWVENRIYPSKDGGLAVFQRDIAARKRAEEERAQLLRRIVFTQEDERRRIARDMHDQFGQQLTAISLKLRMLREGGGEHQEMREELEALEVDARQLDRDVNFLVWELRPTALDDLGLQAALAKHARNWSKHFGVGIELHVSGMERERLTPESETMLYRIAQEALNNIAKHARAGNVGIILERNTDHVSLIIEDDGVGFDSDEVSSRGNGEFGLMGMRERAALVGGTVEIESRPGHGATVFVRIPTLPPAP